VPYITLFHGIIISYGEAIAMKMMSGVNMRISDERLAERAIREQRGVKIKINKTAYATGL